MGSPGRKSKGDGRVSRDCPAGEARVPAGFSMGWESGVSTGRSHGELCWGETGHITRESRWPEDI